RGSARPAARGSAARARRHRLPDGLRRPGRAGQGARGVLRLMDGAGAHSARRERRRALPWVPVQTCTGTRALELLGERWTLAILRESFAGTRRFTDLQRNLGIARNILAARLRTLVDEGVLERHRYRADPDRYDYVLTDRGRALYPAIEAIVRWGG